MTARVQQKEDIRRHLLIIELVVLLLMVILRQPKIKRDRLPLLLLVICQMVPRLMMARKERNRPSPADADVAGNSYSGNVIDEASGTAEGMRREMKSSPSGADVIGNRDSGAFIDNGSGTAEGTTPPPSDIDVTGNLCSGAAIDDGCGEAEATVLLSSVAWWKERVVI